jgi:alkylation response protein AidB-like acyl-CoA dehydrogenase
MVIPEFIQEATRRFESNPRTIQFDGADALLPPRAVETRMRARRYVEERLSTQAREIDQSNQIPEEMRREIADFGFFGLTIPEAYGGRDSVLEGCLVVEEFSRVSAAVGLMVAVGLLASTPIVLGGNEQQQREWLPALASGERFASFCLTEPVAGTDAAGVATRVDTTADGYTVNGLKHFITGAGRSDLYTVFARSGEGRYEMTAMLVPAGSVGFHFDGRHPFTGIRGVPVGQLRFDNVQLPDEACLGEPGRGFQLALATLDRARPGIAAQAIGLAQGAYDASISYLEHRVQFGTPLIEHDVLQHRLARHAAKITAGRMLTYHAAQLADARNPQLNVAASMAKLFATDVAMEVVIDAMQFWGGAGYMTGSPVERMYRDVKILQIYEGTNEIQELVIARAMNKAIQGAATSE